MAALFGWGPRTDVDPSEDECVYGKRVGRAWRDIPELAVNTWAGALVVTYVVGIITGVLAVKNDVPTWIKVLAIIGVISLGALAAVSALFLWAHCWPTAWKRHWTMRIQPIQHGYGHSTISLYSKHHHRIIDLRCVVTDPEGMEWSANDWKRVRHDVLPPKGRVTFAYPQDFEDTKNGPYAPWPEALKEPNVSRKALPGKYRVRWDTRLLDGTKRCVLASVMWKS